MVAPNLQEAKNLATLFEKELAKRSSRFRRVFLKALGICCLCNKPVDPTLAKSHVQFGNIDHIRPLAQGGSNAIDNLQLAHWNCNASKADSYKGQRSPQSMKSTTYISTRSYYTCNCVGSHKKNCWYPSYI